MSELDPQAAQLLELVAVLFLISFTFTALGFLIAWRMESSQGFHAVMNLVLFPLWMVSGALFPMASAHGWMQWLMRVNPMTYGLAALRKLLDPAAAVPDVGISVAVTAGCGLLLLAAATVSANRRSVAASSPRARST